MENNWIKVWIAPDIGGKVWGALDKKTGKYFIYHNNVVKFRDVAMRGPWTSGGIEFNFGSIGHAPTTATPVDYYYQYNSNTNMHVIYQIRAIRNHLFGGSIKVLANDVLIIT